MKTITVPVSMELLNAVEAAVDGMAAELTDAELHELRTLRADLWKAMFATRHATPLVLVRS